MAKTKNITRKNRKQRGGDTPNGQGPSYEKFMGPVDEDIKKKVKRVVGVLHLHHCLSHGIK